MNRQTQRLVRVRDLPGGKLDGRLLYCEHCGAEESANPGDYWSTPGDHAFRCCGRPMRLVHKHTTFEEVTI